MTSSLPSTKRPFRTLADAPGLAGARVIVRAGLNVPLVAGAVRDSFRVKEACETILYLTAQGASVVVLAHIGRKPEETLKPVADCLKQFVPVQWAGAVTGETVTTALAGLKDGDVILLENVRSDAREGSGDDTFAQVLASYGDMYVNDAFADSHRAHASVVGIPRYLPSYAGLLFTREYDALIQAFDPVHLALFVLGGAKFETKMPLVERFARTYDHIFIGGAIANDFLKGKGYEVGKSMVSDVDLTHSALLTDVRISIPSDVVVHSASGRRTVAAEAVVPDERILDVGPQTLANLAPTVAEARTLVWNGPLGAYEDGYDEATKALAQMIADSSAHSIVGGGDTLAAIEALGLKEKFGFVSTAGGAMLQFLQDKTLPGIEALQGSRAGISAGVSF